MIASLPLGAVKLSSGIFKDRENLDRDYLMELDTTCLLQNHYLEAGFILPGLQVVDDPAGAKLHWGWEAPNCQLRGHFLGHWMSAAARLVEENDDYELGAKLKKVVEELKKCQTENGGEWVGPIPEKYFTRLEKGQYIWSPQYTMHKTLMGLLDVYIYTGNELAMEILSHQADWYVRWTERMLKVNPHAIYGGEAGGMPEIWATLFSITKEEKYKTLLDRCKDAGTYADLLAGKDPLSNCHSNASIPLAQGAAKLYEVTGEGKWLDIIKAFWKCAVTDRGLYATGGQNAGEFWTPPMQEGTFKGDRNQEFCTVYNMVRLADYLFRFTGEKEYLDFIEKNLYNGFLAQQNRETGMPTYFLPMSSGAKKKWGSKRNDFWCCHGTMVQAQTMYESLCFYRDGEGKRTFISQYIPSKMEQDGLKIEIASAMKYYNDAALFDEKDDSLMSRWFFNITITAGEDETILLRIPGWIAGKPEISIDGKAIDADTITEKGYLKLQGKFENTKVTIYFPETITREYLPDTEEAAFLEGPIVLAGITDENVIEHADDEILIPHKEHTYEAYPWLQSTYRTKGQRKNFECKPLYEVTDEAYTIYFEMR